MPEIIEIKTMRLSIDEKESIRQLCEQTIPSVLGVDVDGLGEEKANGLSLMSKIMINKVEGFIQEAFKAACKQKEALV